ncbi:sensor histidine kinase [Paenibacillus nasutitermitis]|uniref:histidine kinase n=1 Tax=Paenibacillus nasutitermitis TaxID=1652958 RepID=A0A916YLL3_9BACL|nr:HAMP domain-containing sensor histidine kinase [Paenibacillus nasutitermitis]GGD50164.1 two-component sensor histidine kinase [Paenibacillus nasutitermitis]
MRTTGNRIKRLFAPKSLRNQLLARSLFILAALFLLIGILQYFLMQDFLYRNKAQSMEAQIRSLPMEFMIDKGSSAGFPPEFDGNVPVPPPDSDIGQPRDYFLFPPDTSFAYIDSAGAFEDFSENSSIQSPQLSTSEYLAIMTAFKEGKHVDYRIVLNNEGAEQLVLFRPLGMPNSHKGLVQMGSLTSSLQVVLIQQLLTFSALSLLALIFGLFISLPVLRRTLVPLSNMVKAVERTDAGNLADRFPVGQGQEEIDRLSESFNRMLERLETSFEAERETKEQMRRFIADASHELRTPLASIHGFLEVLLRGAAYDKQKLEGALNSMYGESKRINKLVADLLLLAKLDRAPQLQLSEVRLDILIRETLLQLQMIAGSRHVELQIADGIKGHYDPDKIKQVLLNLFHNAVQHTHPETGNIRITLCQTENATELSVLDNGSGIDQEHLDHVFDRFYRSDNSRTRIHGGAGLGLPISKSIAEAHGGTIEVESEIGKGALFVVKFPNRVSSSA